MLKERLNNVKYELLILGYLFIELFSSIPLIDDMNSWCTTPYVLNYQLFGLNSRLLIGSVVYLFTKYLSANILYSIIIITLTLLCFIISVYLSKLLRSSDDSYKFAILMLIVLYFSSPASISFLFNRSNFGRFDAYLIIFTLLSLFFINTSYFKLVVPALCVISVLTHQVFVFTYFSIVVGLLLFKIYEEKFSMSSILNFSITIIITAILFLYLQFNSSHLNAIKAKDIIETIRNITDVPVSEDMIDLEYFKSIKDHLALIVYSDNTTFIHWKTRILSGIIVLLFMLPISVVLINFWKEAIKYTSDKFLKFVLVFMMISPTITLPAFLFTIDWGRWFATIFISQFAFIFYLAFRRCNPIILSLQKMQKHFTENITYIILIIIFMTSLGKFRASDVLLISSRLASNILDMLGVI